MFKINEQEAQTLLNCIDTRELLHRMHNGEEGSILNLVQSDSRPQVDLMLGIEIGKILARLQDIMQDVDYALPTQEEAESLLDTYKNDKQGFSDALDDIIWQAFRFGYYQCLQDKAIYE